MLFYAVFALALVNARLGTGVLVAWFMFILYAATTKLSFPLSFLGRPENLEFLMGVAIALTGLRVGKRGFWLGILLFAAAAIVQARNLPLVGWIVVDPFWRRIIFGGASALIISGALSVKNESAFALWAGRISYPLYLLHFPVMSVLVLYAFVPWSRFDLIIYLGVSIAVAAAFHKWVERPMLRWLRGRSLRYRPVAASEPAPSSRSS